MVFIEEKNDVSSLSIWGHIHTLQTAYFLILYQMILLPNTNFLINKQNKTPKIDPNNVATGGWLLLLYSCLLHKQTELYNQI